MDLRSLQSALNGKSALQEVQRCSHLADSAIVASHVIESHSLSKLIIFAKLFGLLEQIKSRVDVLLLQVVHGKDVADLTQLFAGAGELLRGSSEVDLLDFEKLFKDSNSFNILALSNKNKKTTNTVIATVSHDSLFFPLHFVLNDYLRGYRIG